MTEGVNVGETMNNNGDTGASLTNENQDARTFTQEEVDKIIQARLEKVKKRYDGIDVNEYKSLKSAEEERALEAMKKREEFDKILSQQKEKFSSEINSLRSELTSLKVDGTLLNAAASRGAINAEQVVQLLRGNVGLDETGRPVVFDKNKSVIYDEKTAEPKKLEDLVNEFLDANPHFLRSGPSGIPSQGGQGSGSVKPEVDIASLDMTKPADRELFRKLRQQGKI